jgi:hypothetical protein
MEQAETRSGRRIGRVLVGAAIITAAGAALAYSFRLRPESPEHETVLLDRQFELRRYPAMLVAETVQMAPRAEALDAGFGLLADYLFGETRGGSPLKMVVPVTAEAEGGGRWRIGLIMPNGETRATLPDPGASIAITDVPARRMAAIRFNGRANDVLLARKEQELRDWMASHAITAAPDAVHAFYDPPARPGPLRRNEVLIALG